MCYASRKYFYQYGDAMVVVERGSEENLIFHLSFLFLRISLIIIIIATVKDNF